MNTESLGGKMTTDAGGGLGISLTDTGNGRGLILKDGDGLGQILLCLSHFLVDAACISLLFLPEEGRGSLLIPVLVYNTLAFALQCPVGRRLRRQREADGWCLCRYRNADDSPWIPPERSLYDQGGAGGTWQQYLSCGRRH